MANFIPRLEWNDITIQGAATLDSEVITLVTNTTKVKVGMVIDHPVFPPDTYVISKTSNTVTASNKAGATSAGIVFDLFERLDFIYPSVKSAEPFYDPTQTITDSVAGVRQVITNNVIVKVDLEFRFLTNELKEKIRDNWYLPWALYGNSFRYFESKDEAGYHEYELDNFDFKPVRDFPDGSGNFRYKYPLKLRRVL